MAEDIFKSVYSSEEFEEAIAAALGMGETIEKAIAKAMNTAREDGVFSDKPNLLDNWYFADPINQRGLTSYTGSYHSIDRWENAYTEDIVSVSDGYVQWDNGRSSGSTYVRQKLENPLPTGTYTLSFEVVSLSYGNSDPYVYIGDSSGKALAGVSVNDLGFYSVSYTSKTDGEIQRVQMTIPYGSGIGLSKIKLEKGSVSTLAHDAPPNKVLELAKCQRYQIELKKGGTYIFGAGIAYSDTKVSFFVPLPVTMRSGAAITFDYLYAYGSLGGTIGKVEVTAINNYGAANNGIWLFATTEGGLTAGGTYFLRSEGGHLLLDANL